MIIQVVILLGQLAPDDGAARVHEIIEDAGLGEWTAEVDMGGLQRLVWFDAKVRPGSDPRAVLIPRWQALLDTRGVGDWAKASLPKQQLKPPAKAPKPNKRTAVVPARARWVPVPIPSDNHQFDLFALPSGDLLGCEGGTCWRTRSGDGWEKDPALRSVRAVAGSATALWAGGVALQHSVDGGKTWKNVVMPRPGNFRAPNVTALAVKGHDVVVGISESNATYDDEEAYQFYLFRSMDGGRTFSQLHRTDRQIRAILPIGDEIMFADGEVLRWRPDGSVTTIKGPGATALAQHAGVIFASGAADLYLSRDGGRSFEKTKSAVSARSESGDAVSGTAFGFDHFVESGQDLYAASTMGALRVSGDGVEPVAWGLHESVDALAMAHGFLYAHSGGKLWRTVPSSR